MQEVAHDITKKLPKQQDSYWIDSVMFTLYLPLLVLTSHQGSYRIDHF